MKNKVQVWEEKVMIPTYEIGTPEKNPIFLDKRVYQGSSGEVYPHPVIEKISDEKVEKEYSACFLENQYLKIMILPELGGRVQMAFDKIKQRHFVYYNQVIKPALVGLTGPWISGGIEFNWPQHHRPSTFEAVDFTIEENADGSITVWCSEVERMFRTKGMAGFRLHPDKAYLEIKVKLFNRTSLPQTFLWWANPAVKVNEHYQSVFPPDVNAVFDHGKRDVSRFPIAKGTYYKVDYSEGVDISKYKNIPVPTSYMAIRSDYDFIGCYEHDTQAGMLHVANHHVVPGKKQWTWGNGEFGKAWDRNLTDEDGPYIELMCGAFTDNQPDFSWLMPYEEKSFSQYFMPYHSLGYVKNATKEALLNLEINDKKIQFKFYATSEYKGAHVVLNINGKNHFTEIVDISPEVSFSNGIEVEMEVSIEDLHLILKNSMGAILVEWKPEAPVLKPVPEAAKAAKDPEMISSVEQLYLNGLHLEQYRHATYSATEYYDEALRREPSDVRSNNAMGLWFLKRAKFAEAEQCFSRAIRTLTDRNPNPYDGEPLFNLGLSLKMQGRIDEAYDAFYKSIWNAAWQDAGYLSLAQIASLKGAGENALELVEQSLIRNGHNHKSRHLKVALLRQSRENEKAIAFALEALSIDPFNMGCLYELSLLDYSDNSLSHFKKLIRDNVHTYLEYSLDYAEAGLYKDAISILHNYTEDKASVYPMAYYFIGYFYFKLGDKTSALSYFKKAALQNPNYCFPNRVEEVSVLNVALEFNPSDFKAYYYLGNFWYAKRQYLEAEECWEKSIQLNDKFPTVLRNLSLAYYNKTFKKHLAQNLLEKAFHLDESDARILMELDQLYKKTGKSAEERLKFLDNYPSIVASRDDLYLEKVTLYNQLGQYQNAKTLLSERNFHPWEGGEGKVTAQYIFCHAELAKEALSEHQYIEALALLKATDVYPNNLGEGKLLGAQENDIHFLIGCAYEGLSDHVKSEEYFAKATLGIEEPAQAFFYNDQQPDKIFYQGLAWRKLGNEKKALSKFNKLVSYGEQHLFDEVKMDYFAVSFPDLLIWEDDLNQRNVIHCNYLMGLGYLGLKNLPQALKYLGISHEKDKNHMGVSTHLQMARNQTVNEYSVI
jgi:tetratricopeptide (TPR) repeat protein